MSDHSKTSLPPSFRSLRPDVLSAGAAVWIVGVVQLFACHLVAQIGWDPPYSWALNNISDLGNVLCGPWGDDRRSVCSPRHAVMNSSFVATGLLLLVGLVLLRLGGLALLRSRMVIALFAVAALGWGVAGFFPADVHENVHVVLGAIPIFVAGNLALVACGIRSPRAGRRNRRRCHGHRSAPRRP